ncbi:hypothetical protein LguiB_015807 [Lonicera macranthoides]
MFRLQKHNKLAPKLGERIDFQFSNFQALQVPKGWDKLLVSLISVETGKTIAKSSKAPVQNGTCQWTETLSESFWISQDDSSKYLEECLFKLVLSMGSARSGILGEATVNMAHYMISRASAPVSLPLRKCNYGTILQVQIHCLPPRTRFRKEESTYSNSHVEDQDAETRDMGTQSNGSIDSYTRGLKSPSSQDLGSTSHPGKVASMETSYSASASNHSFNSANGSLGMENFSPRTNSNGQRFNASVRRDIAGSVNSSLRGNYPVADNPSISNRSSFSSTVMLGSRDVGSPPVVAMSSLSNVLSSKNLLEAAEDTIEGLRDEAKMWERDARNLMLELDILSKKFADQSRKQADLEMELSAACMEKDGVKKEVEQLKHLLEESMARQTATEDSVFRSDSLVLIQKELEIEVKFQRELNADLASQLQRNQESNIELVSVLQELEETIVKQRAEIENLSVIELKFSDLEKTIQVNLEEKKKYKESIQLLEQALEEKMNELENERNLNRQSLLELEEDYKSKLSAEEEKVVSLEAKLNEKGADFIREAEFLREKVEELERDCNELTDENLELLCKLKVLKSNYTESEVEKFKLRIHHLEEELGKKVIKVDQTSKKISELFVQIETIFQQVNNFPMHVNSSCESSVDALVNVKKINISDPELWVEAIFIYLIELNKLLEVKIAESKEASRSCEGKMNEKNNAIEEAQKLLEDYTVKVQELEKEIAEGKSEVKKLEGNLLSKEEEVKFLGKCKMELEVQISLLGKEKQQLQENMEIALRESEITTKCLDELRNDLTVLSSSMDSQVSANKVLEKKSSELEKGKHELELHLFEVEEENVELSERVSSLESQLKHVSDERQSSQLELESSKSILLGLEDEIGKLRIVVEAQKLDLEQKLQESEYLKIKIRELQELNESLFEERNSLQKRNGELGKKEVELHENCRKLENELGEARMSLFDCSKKVEALEENLSLTMEEFSSKEKRLEAELNALIQEKGELKEKLVVEENLLNQIYLEKTAEVESLQKKVERLTKRASESEDERERIIKLESSLQEANSLANEKMAENEKMANFLSNYRSSEEKLKTAVNDLELKVTVSEYERQQLIGETVNLKAQLQKMAQFEDEILALKIKLKESKFEKEKLEALLKSISGEHEEMKAEKVSLVEKVSSLKKSMSEFEDCKNKKIALEEKLVKMERDPSSQEGELKNELTRIKRANKQYQRKVQQLEDEKDECLMRVQMLEKDLRSMEVAKPDRSKFGGRKGDSENSFNDGSPQSVGADHVAKVHLLENELAEALEANNKYKSQLQRLLSEGANSNSAAASKKPKAEGEITTTKLSLETELKELQDRYFQMSLKYAEVEAEREDLVMMLKASKSTGKGWFS